ncbi:DNA-3-methyladenine glycosylase [Anthocerotibacter panamensis]|uniref:DNA-3-methyladenine glycosylase n=1 Tax=Anthocerotibacter panamensis TaxID=2857077 RepID=UPI001C406432|nr:DNA-3-methyladenine glycosylase [Anthocerotibacter panamensis]
MLLDAAWGRTMAFFDRSALEVAPELLGWSLHRRFPDGQVRSVRLVEVEAYTAQDPACHAYRGKTLRNAVVFGPGGFAYVYLIYGMYCCLNVVCAEPGVPGAVLLRAAQPGLRGPGILCRELAITRVLNTIDLCNPDGPLWLTPGAVVPEAIIATKRVGITQGVDLLWRFCLKDHPDVSVKPGREKVPIRRP